LCAAPTQSDVSKIKKGKNKHPNVKDNKGEERGKKKLEWEVQEMTWRRVLVLVHRYLEVESKVERGAVRKKKKKEKEKV